MWNLGLAEIGVIVLIGLLIFGPDKLPKAVKTLSALMQQLRSAASDASRSLQDAAGWDSTETRQTLSELADLHPKRLMGSLLDDPAAGSSDRPTGGNKGRDTKPSATDTSAVNDFDPEAP